MTNKNENGNWIKKETLIKWATLTGFDIDFEINFD